MIKKYLYTLFTVFVLGSAAPAVASISQLSGTDLLTSKEISVKADAKKPMVVVFLSAACPCSNSHVKELASLAKEFPGFAFVGIHSNSNEGKELSTPYFQQAKLPFPVIEDKNTKIADEFKALKTPHTFVVMPDGSIAYRGGVSSSSNFDVADKKYLRDALTDIQSGRKVRVAEGRTLGCVISRGEG